MRYALPALIAVCVVACFLPVLHNDFVNWDDTTNFIDNPYYRGLAFPQLRWMFTAVHLGHYQPLTWLTHGLVYTIWGMNPVAYHCVNLLIHATNAVLFYFLALALLRRAGSDGRGPERMALRAAAAVGALFFAIHPLRVEAVAWATERREVLSAFFLLLTVHAYLRMCDKQVAGAPGSRRWLGVSVGCYALALLSKVIGMTLPVILLALDCYPLGRFARRDGTHPTAGWASILVEKIPYALFAAGAGAVGLIAGGPEGIIGWKKHGLVQRLMQSAYGLSFYLWKTVLPVGLSPLYLLEDSLNPTEPRYVVSALLVVGISVALVLQIRRFPGLFTTWFCYGVLASPVLGLTQGGPQIAADRYCYLASMPLAVLVAAGVAKLWGANSANRLRWVLLYSSVFVVAALAVLGARTYQQAQVWHDSESLWNHALAVDPMNHEAYTGRGDARLSKGDLVGALADFNQALSISPGYHYAHHKRGYIRQLQGNLDAALADYDQAFIHRPIDAVVHNSRGKVRFLKGDFDGAVADLTVALRLRPDFAEAYYNRGNARKAQGDLDGALADYSVAIHLSPHAYVYNNRGTIRLAQGDLAGAIADFTLALQLEPSGPNRATFDRNLARARQQLAERGTPR